MANYNNTIPTSGLFRPQGNSLGLGSMGGMQTSSAPVAAPGASLSSIIKPAPSGQVPTAASTKGMPAPAQGGFLSSLASPAQPAATPSPATPPPATPLPATPAPVTPPPATPAAPPANPYSTAYQNAVAGTGLYNQTLAAYNKGLGQIAGTTGVMQPFVTGQEQAFNEQYAPQLQGAATEAQNLQGLASLAAPTTQFGVLTSPLTGQPVTPGTTASSAAFQGGEAQGANTAGQNYTQMNIANTAAKGIQGTIQQYIQQNPDLNASPSTVANAAQQWLQGKQLGDPRYQQLFNDINEYISTLAPILGVGGDTTNLKTQIAQSFVNAQASGQSISDVLSGIGALADQKLSNIHSAGTGGGVVAGGNPLYLNL